MRRDLLQHSSHTIAIVKSVLHRVLADGPTDPPPMYWCRFPLPVHPRRSLRLFFPLKMAESATWDHRGIWVAPTWATLWLTMSPGPSRLGDLRMENLNTMPGALVNLIWTY